MKRIISYFFVGVACFLLYSDGFAVDVIDYNGLQTNLLIGNDISLIQSDIIKANSNSLTVNVPSSLTITGNGRNIDMNRIGNMMTIAANSINVTLTSAAVRNGNYTGAGGAISITGTNSRLNVSGSTIFNNNSASNEGGAIYASNNSSLNFTGKIIFSNNSTEQNGGSISLTAGASADFLGSELEALGNHTSVGNGGFLSAVSAGTINFATATFTGNTALSVTNTSGFGGVIFSSGGSTIINFTGNTSFINNASFSAGAMYVTDSSEVTFSGTNTVFQDNQSSDAVGALLVRNGARIFFRGDNTVFKDNFMTNNRYGTGAVDIAYNAYADFTRTKVTAQGNNAGATGWGGFLWADSSTVFFGDILVGGANADEGNVAYYGGGIYAGNLSTMNFNGANMIFRNNRAGRDGGGLYVTTGSVVTFTTSSSATFMNNTAGGKGGAVAVNNSSVIFNTPGGYFYGNAALLGGAISIEAGSEVMVVNGEFVSNHANISGGAVYIKGNDTDFSVFRSSTLPSAAAKTIFRGNSADGVSNAIYLDNYSRAFFYTDAGTSVEMVDGVSGSTNAATYFEISGAGDFNLYGTFDTLDLNSKGNFNLKAGSLMDASTVNNDIGARFNMQNEISDTAYMKTLNNKGTLAIDIFQGSNDTIIISGNLDNETSSVLEVKADHITNEEFRKKIYRLINYETYTGSFSAVNVLSPAVLTKTPEVSYGGAYLNWVTLAVLGNKNATDFGKIEGETFNQQEAADALDKISETVNSNDPWDIVLSDIESRGDETIKEILTYLAGYFLPNVIRNAATDSPNNEIYDRIKNHCREEHTISNALWVQAKHGIETFYENDNSPGDYKDISTGFMAGYDRFMKDSNLMLGIYGRFGNDSIEQGKNRADGTKTGAGIYGGYIKKDWELKALSLLSFDSFETKRYIPYINAAADAEIKTTTLNFDLEGAFKLDVTFNTKFRPYAGFEFANASYGAFKENAAGICNLDVKGGNYLRTAGRIGAGLQYEEDILDFYANVEAKYLFSGTEPEINNVFEGTNASFKTRGAKEGDLELGGGAGVSLRLTEGLKIFVNANYYGAARYQNLYGNVGLRYTFCKPTDRSDRVQQYSEPYHEPEPAQVSIPILTPEPAVQRSEDIDMMDEKVVEEQKIEAIKRREKPILKSYSLNMASFAVGKSELTDEAKKDIAREAEEIKQFNYKRIIIEGHTDSTGGNLLNKELSKARAKAVYDEFVLYGIAEEKMMYIGFGPTMPRDTNVTAEGRANNRRVEIFVE
ncbi:MAG: autotransporter domain-containing protein [Endomicrobium sp.]|nr:autotransporter domain-containing protein [Endomicrobium sp.]